MDVSPVDVAAQESRLLVAAYLAKRVVADPAIAPALKPISRLKSETIQGIVAAGLAPTIVIIGKWCVEIAEGEVV